jgi:predicted DNA-binding protein
MAKKRATKMQTTQDEKTTRPVRLDLAIEDHERLERCAKRLGLSKSSYVRLALFERMEADEEKG